MNASVSPDLLAPISNQLQPVSALDKKDSGAMFASATVESRATADLTAIPKIKTVRALDMKRKDAYRLRERQYEKYCGGRNRAQRAKVFAQLMFYYQLNNDGNPKLECLKKGAYWWAHTVDQYAAECLMEYDETRRALEGLENAGIIETWNTKSRASKGVTCLHIRWTGADGAAALTGYPDFDHVPNENSSGSAPAPNENDSGSAPAPIHGSAPAPNPSIKRVSSRGKKDVNSPELTPGSKGNTNPEPFQGNQGKSTPKTPEEQKALETLQTARTALETREKELNGLSSWEKGKFHQQLKALKRDVFKAENELDYIRQNPWEYQPEPDSNPGPIAGSMSACATCISTASAELVVAPASPVQNDSPIWEDYCQPPAPTPEELKYAKAFSYDKWLTQQKEKAKQKGN